MGSDRYKTSMEWPTVVGDRLRLLVGLTERSNLTGPTSATELVAALICAQPIDVDQMGEAVRQYRQMDSDAIAAETRRYGLLAATPTQRSAPQRAPDSINYRSSQP